MDTQTRGERFGRATLIAALLAIPMATRVDAVQCGDVVGPNQTVVLDESVLGCQGPAAAVTVIGPATLDLNRFTVACAESEGSPIDGVVLVGKRAVVRNGYVRGPCRAAVRVAGEGRHQVLDLQTDFAGIGALVESDRNFLWDVHAYDGTGHGFLVRGSRNRIESCVAIDDDVGFVVAGGVGNQLTNDAAIANRQYGYLISGGEKTVVRKSHALANLRDGFRVSRGLRHTLKDDVAAVNDGSGFYVGSQCEKVRIQSNQAEENGTAGIQVWTGGHRLTRNTSLNNDTRQEGYTDLEDRTGGCGANKWRKNVFASANAACIE